VFTCDNYDITSYATVPLPQFQIFSSPNPLELRPREEKTVQLKIKSEASIDSVALVSSNVTESGIQTNLTSELISIRPFGNGTTTLRVEALDNATVKTYQLPILVNITFPKILKPAIGEGEFPAVGSTIIPKNFDLTLSVLPGPGLKEHLDNFAAFISPLNSVWTFLAAIGAVIVPLIIRRKQKDQKEKEQKEDNG
jgi:hypothetical protein